MSDSPRIDRELALHVANLARLELDPGEVESMARDLTRILGYVEALEELDTDDIEPTSHALPLQTPMRPDVAAPPMDPERALANAPERAGSAFAVPKVLAGDEDG
ncbi:MAG: Asp-tRNA(Asn)/Glu-tRNA(Gln) amidotransferase subunit GatC [Myxococcota bacterium]